MLNAKPLTQNMQIKHGHNGQHVVIQFTQSIDNLNFTPEQAQALIDSVRRSMEMLVAYQAEKAKSAMAIPPLPEAAGG